MFQVFVQLLDRPPSAGGFQNLISFLSPSAGRTELNKFHASMLLPKFPTLGDEIKCISTHQIPQLDGIRRV